MKLAFHTNALGQWTVGQLAQWAKDNGFGALEVGPSILLNEAALRQAVDETGVKITCFCYCQNVLDVDAAVAALKKDPLYPSEPATRRSHEQLDIWPDD